MAGDHHNDMVAAAGLGMPAIFAAWGYSPPEVGRDFAAIATRFANMPDIAARLMERRAGLRKAVPAHDSGSGSTQIFGQGGDRFAGERVCGSCLLVMSASVLLTETLPSSLARGWMLRAGDDLLWIAVGQQACRIERSRIWPLTS